MTVLISLLRGQPYWRWPLSLWRAVTTAHHRVSPCLICGELQCDPTACHVDDDLEEPMSAKNLPLIQSCISGHPVWSACSDSDPRWLHLKVVKHLCVTAPLHPLVYELSQLIGPKVLSVMCAYQADSPWSVCAVPARSQSLKKRGVSPQHCFAQALTHTINHLVSSSVCRYLPRLLSRIRETPHQHQLSRAERMTAQRDSLQTTSLCAPCIVLVDDVMTTGGTLREGIRALKASGAQEIVIVTLFKVGSYHPYDVSSLSPPAHRRYHNLS